MFQKRCTCFFDNIWAISAKFWTFRSILDFRAVINSQYIVNILLSPALRSSAGCSNPCKYWQYIDYWWPFQLLQQSIQLFCTALGWHAPRTATFGGGNLGRRFGLCFLCPSRGNVLTAPMAFWGFVLMTSFLALRASVCVSNSPGMLFLFSMFFYIFSYFLIFFYFLLGFFLFYFIISYY